MDFIIEGGQVPSGEVSVSGAKNAATRMLAAALLTDQKVVLNNFPVGLVDARNKMRFIRENGGDIQESENSLIVDASGFTGNNESFPCPVRTTYLLAAGLLRKSNRVKVHYPGGCKIGSRGYDLHIMVWEKFGCKVREGESHIEISAPSGLTAGKVDFPISTVGGTENALLCASICEGVTEINNAYITPEIENLIAMLSHMGASISVHGGSYIKVLGTKDLSGGTYEVIPDRIEAITWLVYGALAKGNVKVKNVPFECMDIPLHHIRDAGIDYYRNETSLIVEPDCLVDGQVRPFEVACGTHPGVISDMQPFYVMLGLGAEGVSRVFDYRYPDRVQYVNELAKFCPGSVSAQKGVITTRGQAIFRTAEAEASDLRGTMSAIMAGLLCPEGKSVVRGVEMALRGYDGLQEKLARLGVEVEAVTNE